MTSFTNSVDGNLLCSTTAGRYAAAGERRHLFRMTSGEYSLVSSWLSWCPHAGTRRVFCVDNHIGSHPSVDEALAQFDTYVANGR